MDPNKNACYTVLESGADTEKNFELLSQAQLIGKQLIEFWFPVFLIFLTRFITWLVVEAYPEKEICQLLWKVAGVNDQWKRSTFSSWCYKDKAESQNWTGGEEMYMGYIFAEKYLHKTSRSGRRIVMMNTAVMQYTSALSGVSLPIE